MTVEDLDTYATELERGLLLIATTMVPRDSNGEEALDALEGLQKVAWTAWQLRGLAETQLEDERRRRLRSAGGRS